MLQACYICVTFMLQFQFFSKKGLHSPIDRV